MIDYTNMYVEVSIDVANANFVDVVQNFVI